MSKFQYLRLLSTKYNNKNKFEIQRFWYLVTKFTTMLQFVYLKYLMRNYDVPEQVKK